MDRYLSEKSVKEKFLQDVGLAAKERVLLLKGINRSTRGDISLRNSA